MHLMSSLFSHPSFVSPHTSRRSKDHISLITAQLALANNRPHLRSLNWLDHLTTKI